eukprot:15200806-Ditylum_brightwellii.AAC.1
MFHILHQLRATVPLVKPISLAPMLPPSPMTSQYTFATTVLVHQEGVGLGQWPCHAVPCVPNTFSAYPDCSVQLLTDFFPLSTLQSRGPYLVHLFKSQDATAPSSSSQSVMHPPSATDPTFQIQTSTTFDASTLLSGVLPHMTMEDINKSCLPPAQDPSHSFPHLKCIEPPLQHLLSTFITAHLGKCFPTLVWKENIIDV